MISPWGGIFLQFISLYLDCCHSRQGQGILRYRIELLGRICLAATIIFVSSCTEFENASSADECSDICVSKRAAIAAPKEPISLSEGLIYGALIGGIAGLVLSDSSNRRDRVLAGIALGAVGGAGYAAATSNDGVGGKAAVAQRTTLLAASVSDRTQKTALARYALRSLTAARVSPVLAGQTSSNTAASALRKDIALAIETRDALKEQELFLEGYRRGLVAQRILSAALRAELSRFKVELRRYSSALQSSQRQLSLISQQSSEQFSRCEDGSSKNEEDFSDDPLPYCSPG